MKNMKKYGKNTCCGLKGQTLQFAMMALAFGLAGSTQEIIQIITGGLHF